MSKHHAFRFLMLVAVTLLGIWALSESTSVSPESAARQRAMLAVAPPAVEGVQAQPAAGALLEPIRPATVNLADIPANVYDANNLYDRWIRGEIDLDVFEHSRISEDERLTLQTDALDLPSNSSIQDASEARGNAPVPAGVAFDSLDMNQCCGGGGVTPPDPEMAAGPNHLIAAVNLAFEIYDKNGVSLAGPTTFASFFAPLGGGCSSNPFDPNVVYDEEADRWVLAVDGAGTTYCIAVSQSSNPLGSYNLYAVPAQPVGGEFHDYPHTGVGDSYIVVGANQFNGAIPGGFEGRVWALDKSVMYAGGALSPVTYSTGGNGGTPQPLHLHGFAQGTWPALGSTHYVATDLYDGCTQQVWRWNIPAPPTVVASFNLCSATGISGGYPVNMPQMGGGLIQANDWRNRGFEYRNGYGWVADTVSCNPGGGTVDCVRWDQIDLVPTAPALVQAGVFASSGQFRGFPDLAVNHCDDMAIGYTKTSNSMRPGVWYSGRESSDPAGVLQAEAQLKAGERSYVGFDGAPYRWGDYTGMTIDPDGQTFWYLGEYSKNITAAANWGNYIGSFVYPGCGLPPTPTNTPTPLPTATDTPTPLPTATDTPTPLPTATDTATPLPTATDTATPLPTATDTPTPLPSATNTSTPLPTATDTATPLPSATVTATPLPTSTGTITPLPTTTSTATSAPATVTPTVAGATNTPTATGSPATNTPTPTTVASHTPTPTASATPTSSPSPTATATATISATVTPTGTPQPTPDHAIYLPLLLRHTSSTDVGVTAMEREAHDETGREPWEAEQAAAESPMLASGNGPYQRGGYWVD